MSFGEPFIIKTSDGRELSFPLLKMSQLATLAASLHADRVNAIVEAARSEKLPPDKIVAIRRAENDRKPTITDLRIMAQSVEYAGKFITASIGEKAKELMDTLFPDECEVIAIGVTGLDTRANPEGEKGVNPTSPPDPSTSNKTDGSSPATTESTPPT